MTIKDATVITPTKPGSAWVIDRGLSVQNALGNCNRLEEPAQVNRRSEAGGRESAFYLQVFFHV